MTKLLITLFVLAGTVLPVSANTPISTCATLTTVASYDLTQSITTGSSVCLEVVTSTAGNLIIDCHGYTINADLSPLYVHDNGANVSWTNCVFTHSSTTALGAITIRGNTNGTNSYQNAYNLGNSTGVGAVNVEDSPYAYFDYDGTVSTVIEFYGSTFNRSRYSHVNNSSIYLSAITSVVATGIYVASNNVNLIGNVITGDSNNQYLDDCIVLDTSSGGQISSNTCSHVFDVGIEFVGPVSNTTINNNDIHYYKYAGIACFYGCSVNGVTIYYNTVDHAIATYPRIFMSLNGDTLGLGGTFTNNSITYNSDLDYSGVGGQFGFVGNTTGPWTTYSGNYFSNNDFGHSTGSVSFQSAAGVTDGGSNLCFASNPSTAITCH